VTETIHPDSGDELWLDGNPKEVLVLATEGPALLGRDPFGELEEPDPFIERIEARGDRRPRLRAVPQPPATAEAPRVEPIRREAPPRPRTRRRIGLPRLSEVELPDATNWALRLFGEEERRRLTALTHLVESGCGYDRFGLSPETIRRVFPIFYALYKVYFRVKSEGHEHIPVEGPAILAANHGGLLPFDGAMGVVDTFLHTDPPRLPRAIVERWAGTLPWVNVFFARVGQVIGTRENFADLLAEGHPVLVFPEGVAGIRKPISQRYRLQHFHVGFVEQALRARAPIVPMAFIGTDDQAPILYDVKSLARRLGIPAVPITPTFPWFGPLGLLPYPVGYRIVYGEPLAFHERFGPEGAGDARLLRYLANQVRRTVQHLVDRHH
jgi:1-acyl-sn-glycerol-3-phosphate acyltransferase